MLYYCNYCESEHFLYATCNSPKCEGKGLAKANATGIADQYQCVACGAVTIQVEGDARISSHGICQGAAERMLAGLEDAVKVIEMPCPYPPTPL